MYQTRCGLAPDLRYRRGVRRRRGFPLPLVRVMILAGFGVVGAVWALVRAHRPRPPMVVPASPPPAEAGVEIAAPDLE